MGETLLNLKVKHKALLLLSMMIPLNVLRKQYSKSQSGLSVKLLCAKAMHIISKGGISKLVDGSKYICFHEDMFNYKVFNMCYMSNMLGKALFAAALGAVPQFEIKDADGDNYFEQFFEKIQTNGKEICSNSRYDLSKKNIPGVHWDLSREERRAYQELYHKYFVLKKNIRDEYDIELKRIKELADGSEYTGIVLRGTDYVLTKPKGHPVQPDVKEIEKILEEEYKDSYFYVATDEERLLKELSGKFGNRVVTSESRYFDDIYDQKDKRISFLSFDRENDKYLKGYEYYRKLYIMSKLDNVVFGMSGASRMVLIMRKPCFKREKILFNSLY